MQEKKSEAKIFCGRRFINFMLNKKEKLFLYSLLIGLLGLIVKYIL